MHITESTPSRRGRIKHSFEDSAVASDLKYWGYYYGRLLAADGFSPANTLSRLLEGSGGNAGHKVLIRDMKPKAWDIHARVMKLPDWLRAALIVRYCLPPNELPSGAIRYYSQIELAGFLGVSRNEYQRRLREAKRRYRNALFGLDGNNTQAL